MLCYYFRYRIITALVEIIIIYDFKKQYQVRKALVLRQVGQTLCIAWGVDIMLKQSVKRSDAIR